MNNDNHVTEAEALDDQCDEGSVTCRVGGMIATYDASKSAKVGMTITCPTCERRVQKRSYQQAFCCTRCKDRYWNTVDETRRARACQYR